MIRHSYISSPLIFLILMVLLTVWLDQITRPSEQTQNGNLYRNPDYIVEDLAGIRVDHENEIQRKFTAKKLFHYLNEEVTELEQIGFTNIEPKNPLMRVYADQAEVRSKGQDVLLKGNVTAIRGSDDEKGKITLRTDFMRLFPDENLVRTDQAVTISRLNSTINAIGLEFNNRTGVIQLLSKVNAVNKK